jgi:hypothetical protein
MTMRLSNDYWNEAKSQRGLTEKSDMTGYWNEIDPKETRAIIQNERDCFRTRAESDAALEAQGRFKKTNETTIVGATPSAPYPAQPPNSPWAYADRNPEPPFDTDISAVEPILNEPTPDPETGQHLPVSDVVGSGPATDGIAAGQGGSRQQSPSASSQPSRSHFRRRF